jgi:transposase
MEKYIVRLMKDEQVNLLSLINKGKASARKLTHARILLAADESDSDRRTDEVIAELLRVSNKTVHRVRKNFVAHGIDGALERKPHSAKKPRKIQGIEEAHLIALCCSSAPEGRCRWTLKLLADKLVSMEIVDSVSAQTVGRVLKKTN